MFRRALARQVEIWPTMFGTLRLAIAKRVVLGTARQHGLRKVDAVAEIAVLEKVAQLLGDHDRAVLLRLPGGGAEMRQRDDRGWSLSDHAREVAHVGVQTARIERGNHRGLVHDRRAREVQQRAVGLHERQARCVHELRGCAR